MENNEKKRISSVNHKENGLSLQAIQLLVKTSSHRETAYGMLHQLDKDQLSKEHKVSYLYLLGRYHFYKYKEDNDIENLEIANDFYDELMKYAFDQKLKLSDSKIFYSRAFTKFELANKTWDAERKPWLLKKVKEITEKALSFNSENSSFLWLQNQLQV